MAARVIEIAKPSSCVEAIADLREGGVRDLKEMQAIRVSMATVAFNSVYRNGERRPTELRGGSESFDVGNWRDTSCARMNESSARCDAPESCAEATWTSAGVRPLTMGS